MIKKLGALFFATMGLVEGAILAVYLISMWFYLFPKILELTDGMIEWLKLSSSFATGVINCGPAMLFVVGLAIMGISFYKYAFACLGLYDTLSVVNIKNQPEKEKLPAKTPNEA